jgi:hypothetical protein
MATEKEQKELLWVTLLGGQQVLKKLLTVNDIDKIKAGLSDLIDDAKQAIKEVEVK